jgi:hypothetical protein
MNQRGKMNAVRLNLDWVPNWIKAVGSPLTRFRSQVSGVIGAALARFWPWAWGAVKAIGRGVRRLRPMVPGTIVAVLAGATIAVVIWLHSAARASPDAWPSSVAAGTTATLALITLWYAYLTHRLLEAQRSAARTAGWESALRDLSLYLNREREVIWTASDYFPVDRPDLHAPDPLVMANTRVELTRIRDHLLEILGLLPRRFVVKVLPLTARLVDAEVEMNALVVAICEGEEAAREAGRTAWTWDDAQQAHEASDDAERSEAWADIAGGRYFHVVEHSWDELSGAIDNYLID